MDRWNTSLHVESERARSISEWKDWESYNICIIIKSSAKMYSIISYLSPFSSRSVIFVENIDSREEQCNDRHKPHSLNNPVNDKCENDNESHYIPEWALLKACWICPRIKRIRHIRMERIKNIVWQILGYFLYNRNYYENWWRREVYSSSYTH